MKASKEYRRAHNPKVIWKWEVPSDSNNEVYEVTVDEKGEWECSCPGDQMHDEPCKHIKRVQTYASRLIDQ